MLTGGATAGISAVQVRTGGCCHLEASLVATRLAALDLAALDVVIIADVGNLVCPAESPPAGEIFDWRCRWPGHA